MPHIIRVLGGALQIRTHYALKQLATSSLIYTGGPGYTKTLSLIKDDLENNKLKIGIEKMNASLKINTK